MLVGRLAFLLLICVLTVGNASAQAWEDVDPATAGWSTKKLEAARLQSKALKPTALMIVYDGRVIAW